MPSEFKAAFTSFLNTRARILDEARESFVDRLSPENWPAEMIIEREAEFFDELASGLLDDLMNRWLPPSIAAARTFSKRIGSMAGLELPANIGVTQARLDLAARSVELAADIADSEFQLKMEKLGTAVKPSQLLEIDLATSRPSFSERVSTGKNGRVSRYITYGAGKYYAPGIKRIWQAVEEELVAVTSTANMDMQAALR